MESFLTMEGTSLGNRKVQKTPVKTKILLFNPKPRQKAHFSSSANRQPSRSISSDERGHHVCGRAQIHQLRRAKLREQAPTAVSRIFAGLSFYFNGRTGDKQTAHLKSAVSKHGGRTTPVMSMRGVTHVIAENLSGVKTEKAMKSLRMKVIHPDWVKNCIAEGRLLPEVPFRVVRSQKFGVGDFFPSSASASSPRISKVKSIVCSAGNDKQSNKGELGLQAFNRGSLPGRGRGSGNITEFLKTAKCINSRKEDEVQRKDRGDFAAANFVAPLPANHVKAKSYASASDASSLEPTAAKQITPWNPLVAASRKRCRGDVIFTPHVVEIDNTAGRKPSNYLQEEEVIEGSWKPKKKQHRQSHSDIVSERVGLQVRGYR